MKSRNLWEKLLKIQYIKAVFSQLKQQKSTFLLIKFSNLLLLLNCVADRVTMSSVVQKNNSKKATFFLFFLPTFEITPPSAHFDFSASPCELLLLANFVLSLI